MTYSKCVFVASGIPQATRMRHIVICSLPPPPIYNIFPHYLTNGMIFKKKKLLNTKCVFWFSIEHLSETFLILRRIERDMIKNVYCMNNYILTLTLILLMWKIG
jgi:hypothetical protein